MRPAFAALALLLALSAGPSAFAGVKTQIWSVPAGAGPHDVAADPAPDGLVYYTAQRQGALGILDPKTGKVEQLPLGSGSHPHGVIVGPDRAAWITDSGLNAIVRVDPTTRAIKTWPLPKGTPYANLNTATFDKAGVHWFTGQSGFHGRVDPKTDKIEVWESPHGRGPYGIATTPGGDVFYASLAGSHIARINLATGVPEVIRPPTANQGARRVWSDSKNGVWVSEWNSGNLVS
ncbi:MAG: lyase [Alphaproteobacteria bacterium]|nr:lyase [Alphaproteobacteria bacterium]